MSTTFSSVDDDRTRTRAAVHASRSAAVSISAGSGSAATRHGQSAGIRRGRTANHSRASATSTRVDTSGGNHGTSFHVSVKSSWATWIQYSWGSFTTIQMAAAVMTQERVPNRRGSQRSRTASYAMKKYSKVFGKTS